MLRGYLTRLFAPGISGASLLTYFNTNQEFDKIDPTSSPTAKTLESEIKAKTENGTDRLQLMFSIDEYGGFSPEIESVAQVATLSGLFGMAYGGFIESKKAYVEFMERNQATAFKDHLHAKKMLQDAVTLSFAKGAFRWGWRLCFFSTSYVFISTVMSVYRDKSSIWEYIVAGCVTGALYKFRMGPQAMVAGGTLGTMLGVVAGGTTVLLLKLGGFDMKDLRNWQYSMHQSREKALGQAIKKYNQKEDLELFKEYASVNVDNRSLDNIDLPPDDADIKGKESNK